MAIAARVKTTIMTARYDLHSDGSDLAEYQRRAKRHSTTEHIYAIVLI